jgi:AT-rich interactive domain-containing protein 1
VSNALRALSLVPGNETTMAKHAGLMLILGRLLLVDHQHVHYPIVSRTAGDRAEPADSTTSSGDSIVAQPPPCTQPIITVHLDTLFAPVLSRREQATAVATNNNESHLSCLRQLRDDSFVILTQLSVVIDLFTHERDVAAPLVAGLLHWSVCRAAEARDLLTPGKHTPQEYALEALCKLSVKDENVDMLLSLGRWPVLERFIDVCAGYLSMATEQQQMREFSIVLTHAMCASSSAVCVHAAKHTPTIQHLVAFLEFADNEMHQVCRNQFICKCTCVFGTGGSSSNDASTAQRSRTHGHIRRNVTPRRRRITCYGQSRRVQAALRHASTETATGMLQ